MTIKAKTIFKLVAIVCVPLTGYLAARGTKKYQEEMEMLKEEKPEADITTSDKIKVAAKSYGMAAATGVTAVGSIIAIDKITYKELVAAGGAIALGKNKLERKIREYNAYRDATIANVGRDAERDIRKDASEIYIRQSFVSGRATDETVHTFRLDWFGNNKWIYFDATYSEVMSALMAINAELADEGCVRAINILTKTGHSDLITDEMKPRCWDDMMMQGEQKAYIPFDTIMKKDGVIEITAGVYPNDDYDEYMYNYSVMPEELEGVI
jgi:hypothetical protein